MSDSLWRREPEPLEELGIPLKSSGEGLSHEALDPATFPGDHDIWGLEPQTGREFTRFAGSGDRFASGVVILMGKATVLLVKKTGARRWVLPRGHFKPDDGADAMKKSAIQAAWDQAGIAIEIQKEVGEKEIAASGTGSHYFQASFKSSTTEWPGMGEWSLAWMNYQDAAAQLRSSHPDQLNALMHSDIYNWHDGWSGW